MNYRKKKKDSLFKIIKSKNEDTCVKAGYELLNLIIDNSEEMARFVSPTLNMWLITPEDIPYKAHYLWLYFKHHLKKTEKGEFIIGPIS
jgi:hypothetical protein